MAKKKNNLANHNQVIIGSKSNKNKVVAALLAIFLGGIGIHKFYLGSVGWGVLYILFAWTWIPMIVGFIEGLMYLFMSDKTFEAKYH